MDAIVAIPPNSDFPLDNLPYSVFSLRDAPGRGRVCVALGEHVVDLQTLQETGYFSGPTLSKNKECFSQGLLNPFLELGRTAWTEARHTLTRLLSGAEGALRDDSELFSRAVLPMADVQLHLPFSCGDYTDFYASLHHATNCGVMLRGKDNALQPNWLHLPVGYHGRASSIIPSGTPVRRPWGQVRQPDAQEPLMAASQRCDFELEVGAVIGTGNDLGSPIVVDDAASHIFGLVLSNDWSARDIQSWEMTPLGPFNSKNFATQISPWVVTTDALEAFKCSAPCQSPAVLPYLQEGARSTWDLQLSAGIVPAGASKEVEIASSNLKYMYWTFSQMVTHHTVGGCNLRPGDLLGSGTVSGPERHQRGCLLEATWAGSQRLQLSPGVSRGFLEDGDEVVLRGWCGGGGSGRPRIGFGACRGVLLPARAL